METQSKTLTLEYGQLLDQALAEGTAEASQKYYTFAGWYTAPIGGSKYAESGDTMPASDVTIYAHWNRTSNEVVYKDWNGTIIDRARDRNRRGCHTTSRSVPARLYLYRLE